MQHVLLHIFVVAAGLPQFPSRIGVEVSNLAIGFKNNRGIPSNLGDACQRSKLLVLQGDTAL